MNREILFRGKRLDNGEWVYGYYLPWHAVTDLQGNEPYAQIFEEYKIKGKYVAKGWVRVNFNTVGQYTGLTDKNGNRIFEGDIVKVKITQTEDIKTYGSCKYKVGFITYNEDFALFTCKNNFMNFINWAFNDCEVIGNIYDNPELLEDMK